MTVRRRHTVGAYKRSTHSPSSIDFSNPAFSTTLYSSQADLMPVGATDVTPGAVLPGTIAPGAITGLSEFGSSVRPVAIVGVLPTLPNGAYPIGATVVLTIDSVLYQNDANVWVPVGGGIEIVGALPALPDGDYPVGSVVSLTTDGKLYRNVADVWTKAVDGADLIADSVTANAIAVATITATEIAATTITGSQLAAGAVTAGKIAAGAIATTDFSATATIALVTNGGANVVIDASGITITGGAITVTNPGSVVIIDGTSDMFRISSSGTATLPTADPASPAETLVTLSTGLTYPPSYLTYMDNGSGDVTLLPYVFINWSTGHTDVVASTFARLYGTNQTQLGLAVSNSTGSSWGGNSVRYYLLEQVAI